MMISILALSFALGAFTGIAVCLMGVSVAWSRETDRRLHQERLRRAAHWGEERRCGG